MLLIHVSVFAVAFRVAQGHIPIFTHLRNVYRKHRENLDLCPLRYNRTEVESPVTPVAYSLENAGDIVTPTTSVTQQSHHNHQIAKFLLKLKEVRKVSQTAIDGLVGDISLMIQQIASRIQTNCYTFY